MPKEESFMLISLKEKQSKQLAQTISNETCRAILDYLANKEYATETQVSKELGIPLSTAHYNLKLLSQSKLVETDEYHYSDKGKEVPHYKLANKFIIIAPKDEQQVLDKIKRFWPVTAIILGVAAALEFGQRLLGKGFLFAANEKLAADMAPLAAENASWAVRAAGDAAAETMLAAGNATAQAAPLMVQEAARQFPTPATLWFLGGALFVLLVLVVWELVKKK
ncbi:helix-turn-helix transcriptional regulator [Candidatus Woesearchaeota archaeon]|nr:helix-turn-helix transcriptional regulator [Candidatus Woesearchaeota archaeon]